MLPFFHLLLLLPAKTSSPTHDTTISWLYHYLHTRHLHLPPPNSWLVQQNCARGLHLRRRGAHLFQSLQPPLPGGKICLSPTRRIRKPPSARRSPPGSGPSNITDLSSWVWSEHEFSWGVVWWESLIMNARRPKIYQFYQGTKKTVLSF